MHIRTQFKWIHMVFWQCTVAIAGGATLCKYQLECTMMKRHLSKCATHLSTNKCWTLRKYINTIQVLTLSLSFCTTWIKWFNRLLFISSFDPFIYFNRFLYTKSSLSSVPLNTVCDAINIRYETEFMTFQMCILPFHSIGNRVAVFAFFLLPRMHNDFGAFIRTIPASIYVLLFPSIAENSFRAHFF